MKKLSHCYLLKVVGPVNIEGLAKQFIENCTDHAINDKKNLFLLEGIAAVVVDVYGGGGAATSAVVVSYVNGVKDDLIYCLTDTTKMQQFLTEKVKETFKGSVEHESHWVYWTL